MEMLQNFMQNKNMQWNVYCVTVDIIPTFYDKNNGLPLILQYFRYCQLFENVWIRIYYLLDF